MVARMTLASQRTGARTAGTTPVALGTRLPSAGLAFLTYLVGSLLIFGRDVVTSPTNKVIGDAGADKTIFMWSFKWWPHAIAHGHDPLDANVVWVPHGIDLSWVTSAPLVSLLMTPITYGAGPVVAYNVAMLLVPAFNGWAAYVLARWLTTSFWPSLVAGWLFAFSAFELGQMVGHLNLALVMFIPLTGLLILRHLGSEISNSRFVTLLALTLVGQFLTSTELFVTLVLVIILFGLVAAVFNSEIRDRLRLTAIWATAATGIALLVVSPYLWHAFISSGTENAPERSPYSESADLLNYVIPTRRIWLQFPGSASIANHFTASGAERGAYLSIPLIAIVLGYLIQARRRAGPRVVAIVLGLIIIASLGASIRFLGHGILPGPWKLPAALPLTRTILPVRLTVFVALIASLIAAAWLSERPLVWRWALVLVAVVLVFPNPATSRWSAAVPNPHFFKTSAYRRTVKPGDRILILPYGGAGWSLLWQAEDGFRYNLIGGHFGKNATPSEAQWSTLYRKLNRGLPPSMELFLRQFLSAHDTNIVVIAPGATASSQKSIERLGLRPARVADVTAYRVR